MRSLHVYARALAGPAMLGLSVLGFNIVTRLLTKPYVFSNPPVVVAGATVHAYTVVNPGPGTARDAFLELAFAPWPSNSVSFSYSSGVDVKDVECVGGALDRRIRASRNTSDGRKLLPGDSFTLSVVFLGIQPRDYLRGVELIADAQKRSATDADAGRGAWIFGFYNAVLVGIALISTLLCWPSISSEDENTVDNARGSANRASKRIGKFTGAMKNGKVARRPGSPPKPGAP